MCKYCLFVVETSIIEDYRIHDGSDDSNGIRFYQLHFLIVFSKRTLIYSLDFLSDEFCMEEPWEGDYETEMDEGLIFYLRPN